MSFSKPLQSRKPLEVREYKKLWSIHKKLRKWPDLVDQMWRAKEPLDAAENYLLEEAVRRLTTFHPDDSGLDVGYVRQFDGGPSFFYSFSPGRSQATTIPLSRRCL